jgi:hypothetical protein
MGDRAESATLFRNRADTGIPLLIATALDAIMPASTLVFLRVGQGT